MALSMVGPSTTALMIAQGKLHRIFEHFLTSAIICLEGIEFGIRGGAITSDVDPNYLNFIWPKLLK